MTVTNTSVNYGTELFTAVKSSTKQGPEKNVFFCLFRMSSFSFELATIDKSLFCQNDDDRSFNLKGQATEKNQ